MTEDEVLTLFLSILTGVLVTLVVTRAAKVDFNDNMSHFIKQANKLRFYFLILLATSFWAYVLLSIFTSLMTT